MCVCVCVCEPVNSKLAGRGRVRRREVGHGVSIVRYIWSNNSGRKRKVILAATKEKIFLVMTNDLHSDFDAIQWNPPL